MNPTSRVVAKSSPVENGGKHIPRIPMGFLGLQHVSLPSFWKCRISLAHPKIHRGWLWNPAQQRVDGLSHSNPTIYSISSLSIVTNWCRISLAHPNISPLISSYPLWLEFNIFLFTKEIKMVTRSLFPCLPQFIHSIYHKNLFTRQCSRTRLCWRPFPGSSGMGEASFSPVKMGDLSSPNGWFSNPKWRFNSQNMAIWPSKTMIYQSIMQI